MTRGRRAAEILAIGMVTPVGLSARQTAASVRTGITRLAESYMTDRFGEPLVMGLVDHHELPPLVEELQDRDLSLGQERVARLGAPALLEALGPEPPDGIPLLLGIAEPRAEARHPMGPEMLEILATQAGCRFDQARSRVYPLGRPAGLVAVGEALDLLDRREAATVLVGAIDTTLDAGWLEALDDEGRLKTGKAQEMIADGFIPGEGAAFLRLAAPGTAARQNRDGRAGAGACAGTGAGAGGDRRGQPIARIVGVGRAREAGHFYSDQPHRGDGLAAAFAALFAATGAGDHHRDTGRNEGSDAGGDDRPAVGCVYAGLNGESYWAKEWGVAQIRSAGRLRPRLRVEHPADCIGDAGAALGLVMLGLGAMALARGQIEGDCLIWAGADRGERAAVLLSP